MEGSFNLMRITSCTLVLTAIVCALFPTGSLADEAQWIWASGTLADDKLGVNEVCFFRKPINLKVPSEGRIEITADDTYELYVNGQRVGSGGSSRQMDEYDISDRLEIGRNMIAVRVKNTTGDTAALAARVSVRPLEIDKWFTFSSDSSWKTSQQEDELWSSVLFNDRLWGTAASFGTLGDTSPWDRPEHVAADQETEQRERFQIQKGFGVQRVLNDKQVGSVIAMAFNEFGHIIVSQENGPLLLVYDRDEDGVPDQVRTYCESVKSCQGILALNGDVFVTGIGPEGCALYRLSDHDRNGTLEDVKAIVKFEGQPGEHGPHGLRLGPDGMIYCTLGSYVQAIGKVGPGQTLRDSYEGDLLPRYEDPSGHALDVKAPGGTIIRTNIDGSVVEKVAGGLRNAYDILFHPAGGLFVHDADMEADVDTAWYRPTMLFDVTEAGEMGWRPGWSKWPEHYFDRLPMLLDTGRGSPTGGVCYEHFMFPVRYHNTMFLADWAEGRILNVKLKPRGAGYIADSEVFLKGTPLNVTDIDVGPDGALYFCTGGRGTSGGVYRIVYKGEIPDRIKNLGSGIAAAIRQPQLEAAWSRQHIASIKRDLGEEWSQLITGVAFSNDNPPHYRLRAMDLMQLFGPVPSEELMLELSRAPNESVRARAAAMMALHPGEETQERIFEMLQDSDPRVRRAACEAILRGGEFPDNAESVLELLAEEDRTLAFVARQVLQRMPPRIWRDDVLFTNDTRIALVGMLALINADPKESTALAVLQRASELMTGFLSDADFVDAMRLCEVALHRGQVDPSLVVPLRDQIAEEFPAGDPRMNQEIIRLAAYLGAEHIAPRALEFLKSNASEADRTLVAMHLQFLSSDWTAEQRFQLLKYYENAANDTQNNSLAMYIMNVTRDFADSLSDEDVQAILEQGAIWRNAALAAIYRLERPIDEVTADSLMALDRELVADPHGGDVERRLRTGIIAMLSSTNNKEAMQYLRNIWRNEPERRNIVALGLAEHPDGENWDYLVRSLNVLDESSADDVLAALQSVQVATDDPMALRQLILLGLETEADGKDFSSVEKLLVHWTGVQPPASKNKSMKTWQKWFAESHPDRPIAVLPIAEETRWDFDQLVGYLESDQGKFGNPAVGQDAYKKARCAECHRFNRDSGGIGPDLSDISKRFTRREILESILYPSHIVSDQYASKKVLTLNGKLFVGIVSNGAKGMLSIRDSNNNVTHISERDVDQILPTNSSVMPSGLLDELSLAEISDLMAYLGVVQPLEVATRPKK